MFRAPVHLVLLAVITDCPFPSCYSFWTLNFQSGSLVFFRSISFSSRNSSTLQLHFCLKSTRVLSSYPLWMKSSACGTLTLLSMIVSIFRSKLFFISMICVLAVYYNFQKPLHHELKVIWSELNQNIIVKYSVITSSVQYIPELLLI
ncbi:Hypothetical_protein [Hexamita inflata]|uniref:Hypothetical_protein n=1 Tax=Hexamita inflata TaxID=28002 RepID=A0ABP1H6L6_9EUKA